MNWYNIKNVAEGNITEVMIYDEIGMYGVDAKSFIDDVKNLPKNTSVLLRINSPGGSVIDGLAIYDAISRLPQKVTSRIEGIAASMASVIALAADEVVMSENSLYMIHNVWGGEVGESDDLRKAADLMDKMGERLVNIYVSKSGQKENQMEKEFENLKSFISELFNKTAEAKEVKILDNEEVSNKMSAIEESIEESAKAIVELNGSIVEKDGYIATLTEELNSYKTKEAKKEGMPSDVVPSKDPNPTPEVKAVDPWSGIANSLATNNNLHFKN